MNENCAMPYVRNAAFVFAEMMVHGPNHLTQSVYVNVNMLYLVFQLGCTPKSSLF